MQDQIDFFRATRSSHHRRSAAVPSRTKMRTISAGRPRQNIRTSGRDSRCRVSSCSPRYADAPTVSRSPPAAGGRISSVLRATTVHCCGRTQDCGLYAVLPLSGVQFAGLNHHWYADEPLGVWTEINCALHQGSWIVSSKHAAVA